MANEHSTAQGGCIVSNWFVWKVTAAFSPDEILLFLRDLFLYKNVEFIQKLIIV